MVVPHTSALEEARQLEKDDEYTMAADAYVRSACDRLTDAGLIGNSLVDETTTSRHLAFTELLRAIFCLRKAGSMELATDLHYLFESVVMIYGRQINTPVICGLIDEWLGDGRLLINDEAKARESYENAYVQFDALDTSTTRHWGMEPEVDQAVWVFKDFLRWHEIEQPETEVPLSLTFTQRLQYKYELI